MKSAVAAVTLSLAVGAASAAEPSMLSWNLSPSIWSSSTEINFNQVSPMSIEGGVGVLAPAEFEGLMAFTFELPTVPDGFSGWWVDGVAATSVFNAHMLSDMRLDRCADMSCNHRTPVAGTSFSEAVGLDLTEYRFDGGLLSPGNYQWAFAFSNGQETAFSVVPQIDALAAVPEPSTYALMLCGLGLVGWAARRRRTQG